LNGQAGEGLTVDELGRVHYIGQIRYPAGIYHSLWDGSHWTTPELVYLITMSSTEPKAENIIHAHNTIPIIRQGNQLVVTFTDVPTAPDLGLFVTYRYLDDIEPLPVLPTPEPTPEVAPTETTSIPTVSPPANPDQSPPNRGSPVTLSPPPGPSQSLWIGIATPLLLIGGTVLHRLLSRRY
jgi:hypothetical protein